MDESTPEPWMAPASSSKQGLETDVMRGRVRAALLGSGPENLPKLGRYEVLGPLGRGGMGMVYRARDVELDRTVALKVLRNDRARDDERLRREARALAKLSHPNIVAVLEVGFEDGQVFVAMEYVDGGTLGDWCVEHPLGRPGRFDRALDLALQSLRGLATAHDAGLVHRDLKPSNMLVGRDGRLRIADFGLAYESTTSSASETHGPEAGRRQQTDQRHSTSRDAVAGTPLYMAPEQFQGRATPSSDIFSWCVAFHEVFFGTRPYAAETASGLQEEIAARRFVSPPRSARAPAWLRPILLRGLDVEPKRRWPDVDSLLRAIESRRRPRRWPWVVGSAAALVATVVVARMPLTPQPVIAPCTDDGARLEAVWGPDAREAIHANLDRVAVAYGPATWERIEGRMEELATRWRTDRIEACRQGRDRDPELAAVGQKRTACLDRALDSFAFVAETLADTGQNIAPFAVPLLLTLGDTVGCEVDDLERGPGEVDGEAVAAFDRAMLLDEARRGPEAVAALEALAARLPKSSRLRARTWIALADAHSNLGPLSADAALAAAREALAVAEAAGDSVLLVNAWRTLARAQTRHGDLEDATFAIERAHNLATRPEVDDLERARIETVHAMLLEREGDFAAAADHYRRAIDWHRNMRPGTLDLAFLLVDAAGPLMMAAAPDEATASIAEGLALCEKLVGPEHPETALALVRSAQIGVQIGRDDVLQELERAGAILTANPQFHPEALVDVRMTQADLLRRARRYEEALVAIDEAITALETTLGPDAPFRIALASFRGKILLGLERPEDAAAEARAMLTRFEGVEGPMVRAYGEMHLVLAHAEIALGHADVARQELAAARTALDPLFEEGTVPGHNYRLRVAGTLAELGDHAAALRSFEELAAHVSAEVPPIAHAEMWMEIATLRHILHDAEGATQALDRARQFIDPEDPELGARLAEVEATLAAATPSSVGSPEPSQ